MRKGYCYRTELVGLVVIGLCSPGFGEGPTTWTLPALIQQAERVSPAIAAAQADLAAAQGVRHQEGLYPNPIPGVERAGDLIFRLDQHLENPGSRRSRLDLAEQDIDAAQVRIVQAQLEVRSQVEEAAYQLLADRERERLVQDNVRLLTRVRASLPDRYRPGLGSATAILRMNLETTRAQNDLRLLQADEEQRQAVLNTTLLQPATAPIEVQAPLETALPSMDLARLDSRALEHNTALRLAQGQTSQAQAQLRLARQQRFPGPDAGINLDRPLGESYYLVGFEATVPLPLWNRNQGAIEAAVARLQASQNQSLMEKQMLLAETDRLYQNYRSAQERLQAFRKEGLSEQALKMRTEAMQAYQQGLLNLTDLLDSLRTATQAQDDYIQSLLDGQIARIALMKDIGGEL